MARIFTIGEMLIDFIPNKINTGLKNVDSFTKLPGGAPANVAVCASKLGAETYFVGKFGKDAFGDFLLETLENHKVNTKYTYKTSEANTALAFVSLREDGAREFSFYRNPSADLLLDIDDVKDIEFKKDDIISFCSVGLVDYPIRYATKYLLEKAKSKRAKIIFDPNLRLNLWDDHEDLFNTIKEFSKYADIIKISDDELEFITRKTNLDDALTYLNELGLENIIITKGKYGAYAKFKNVEVSVSGNKVKAVDTTGAGDSFVGALLYKLSVLNKDIENINNKELEDILTFANKVASIVTTKYGAMDSLPSLEEVL